MCKGEHQITHSLDYPSHSFVIDFVFIWVSSKPGTLHKYNVCHIAQFYVNVVGIVKVMFLRSAVPYKGKFNFIFIVNPIFSWNVSDS